MPEVTLMLDTKGNLIDPGTTELTPKDSKVVWVIGDKNIESFRIVSKVPGDGGPFSARPHNNFTTADSATAITVTREVKWLYNIEWKKSGSDRIMVLDPKITVKPDVNYWYYIIPFIILVPLVYFFSSRYFRRK